MSEPGPEIALVEQLRIAETLRALADDYLAHDPVTVLRRAADLLASLGRENQALRAMLGDLLAAGYLLKCELRASGEASVSTGELFERRLDEGHDLYTAALTPSPSGAESK